MAAPGNTQLSFVTSLGIASSQFPCFHGHLAGIQDETLKIHLIAASPEKETKTIKQMQPEGVP